jgi:hypothetical protein
VVALALSPSTADPEDVNNLLGSHS